MFCFQCEEAQGNKGCTVKGTCGKDSKVANLMDTLMFVLKGISFWAAKANQLEVDDDQTDRFLLKALFATVTNVNFSEQRIYEYIKKSFKIRDRIKNKFLEAYQNKEGKEFSESPPEAATWQKDGSIDDFINKGKEVGILSEENQDIRSLKEFIIYGIKGMAAYADHAYILGHKDKEILSFIYKGLAATLRKDITKDELIGLLVETGKHGLGTMALLDKAHTSTYGNPEPTEVFTGTKKGPAILVSGHDLRDFSEILEQTKDKGVNVYTHGEMLPANAYPVFKKYKHFVGNYGTSWYNQQKEFDAFGGSIIMTTNCIQAPKEAYKDRIFTTGTVGWDDVAHIDDRKGDEPKDFSPAIDKALALGDLEDNPGKKLTIGFAHHTLEGVAGKIIELIKAGKIKRFVVMGGCDGRFKEREYFTQVPQELPPETVILTCGCAKYRHNMLDLGSIEGIPRVVDAGQCNDAYSLGVIALKLKEAVGAEDINDLPISYDLAWYEQKAVIVLLALLSIGVKHVRLGPNLPAFVSPGVLKVLVDQFDIKPILSAKEDAEAIAAGR